MRIKRDRGIKLFYRNKNIFVLKKKLVLFFFTFKFHLKLGEKFFMRLILNFLLFKSIKLITTNFNTFSLFKESLINLHSEN